LAFFFCIAEEIKAQKKSTVNVYDIKQFQIEIVNSNYASAYAILFIINNDNLNIYLKGDLEGEKDSLLFSRQLRPSDTLQKLSLVNLDSLKSHYSNDCVNDGSQVTVIIGRDKEKKSVHLSNYYREDIGKIIILVNSIIPDEYRIWYDKKLLESFNNCK